MMQATSHKIWDDKRFRIKEGMFNGLDRDPKLRTVVEMGRLTFWTLAFNTEQI